MIYIVYISKGVYIGDSVGEHVGVIKRGIRDTRSLDHSSSGATHASPVGFGACHRTAAGKASQIEAGEVI